MIDMEKWNVTDNAERLKVSTVVVRNIRKDCISKDDYDTVVNFLLDELERTNRHANNMIKSIANKLDSMGLDLLMGAEYDVEIVKKESN